MNTRISIKYPNLKWYMKLNGDGDWWDVEGALGFYGFRGKCRILDWCLNDRYGFMDRY